MVKQYTKVELNLIGVRNMNKYEEALEYVSNVLDESGSGWGDWCMYGLSEDPIKTFKELVDRETPMKPIWLQNPCTHKVSLTIPICRKCRANLIINYREQNRCPNIECEQKVDWSEDDEK